MSTTILQSSAHITQGQFIKILGSLANDKLMTYLEANAAAWTDVAATDPVAVTCRAFLRVINKDTGLDIDNPEFSGALDFVVSVGAMTPETRQKILDVRDSMLTAATAVPPPIPPKNYRLPRPADIATWQATHASTAQVTEGVGPLSDYIYITGACSDPAAEEV